MSNKSVQGLTSSGVTLHLGWTVRTTVNDAAPPYSRRHEAVCTCGWTGPARRDLALAREDGQEHSMTDRRSAPRLQEPQPVGRHAA